MTIRGYRADRAYREKRADREDRARQADRAYRETIRDLLRPYFWNFFVVVNFETRRSEPTVKGRTYDALRARHIARLDSDDSHRGKKLNKTVGQHTVEPRLIPFREDWSHHFDAFLNRRLVHKRFSRLPSDQRVKWVGVPESGHINGSRHFHILISLPPVNLITSAGKSSDTQLRFFIDLSEQLEAWYPGVKVFRKPTASQERAILYCTKWVTRQTEIIWRVANCAIDECTAA